MIDAVRVKGFLLRIGDHSQRMKQGSDDHNRSHASVVEAPRSVICVERIGASEVP
jgi:hypothetical protein